MFILLIFLIVSVFLQSIFLGSACVSNGGHCDDDGPCCSNVCSDEHDYCIPCVTFNNTCDHSDYCCHGLHCNNGICENGNRYISFQYIFSTNNIELIYDSFLHRAFDTMVQYKK